MVSFTCSSLTFHQQAFNDLECSFKRSQFNFEDIHLILIHPDYALHFAQLWCSGQTETFPMHLRLSFYYTFYCLDKPKISIVYYSMCMWRPSQDGQKSNKSSAYPIIPA